MKDFLIILDTNFLMIPELYGVDIFDELDRVVDRKYTLIVPEVVIGELENIKENYGGDIKNIGSRINNILHKLNDEGFINLKPNGYCELTKEGKEKISGPSRKKDADRIISRANVKEIKKILSSENDLLKSRVFFTIQKTQKYEILVQEELKQYILYLLMNKDEGSFLTEKITWIINKSEMLKRSYKEALLLKTHDDDPQTRKNALKVLSKIQDDEIENLVLERLLDEDIDVRITALKTILKQNEIRNKSKIFQALEEWNEEFKEGEQKDFEKDLGNLDWNEAVKKAIKEFVEKNQKQKFTREELIQEKMDRIIELTETSGKTPEQTLSKILQKLWKKEDFLSHIDKGTYKLKKTDAMEIETENIPKELPKSDIDKKIKKLINGLTEDDKEIQKQKREKLVELCSRNKPILTRLTKRIDSFEWKSRYKVVPILGSIEERVAIIKLINLLEDPNEWVREAAADELKNHQKEIVRIELVKILKSNKHINSRKYADEVLGEFDDLKVLKALEKSLEDDSSTVRKATLRALEKFNHPKVEKILERAKDSDYKYVEKEAKSILKRKRLDKKFDEKNNKKGVSKSSKKNIEQDCNKKNPKK